MFHNTTTHLQNQDHSVQNQDQDRFLASDPIVLRTTVSDYITGIVNQLPRQQLIVS